MPRNVSRSLSAQVIGSRDHGLVVLPLPFDLPPIPLYLSWHQRYDNDSDRAHIWLRDKACAVLRGLETSPFSSLRWNLRLQP